MIVWSYSFTATIVVYKYRLIFYCNNEAIVYGFNCSYVALNNYKGKQFCSLQLLAQLRRQGLPIVASIDGNNKPIEI